MRNVEVKKSYHPPDPNPRAQVRISNPLLGPRSNLHGSANIQLPVHTTVLAYVEIATPGKTASKSQKLFKMPLHHVLTQIVTISTKACVNSAA